VQVIGCFYPLTVQRAILKALRWLLRSLSADATCDLPKHVGDLLTSDVCILAHVMLVISINFISVHRTYNIKILLQEVT
jgi:hypothetical protein